MDTGRLLMKLNKLTGVSAHEYMCVQDIKELFTQYCDDIQVDSFGNLIGIKKTVKPNAYKIMLAAHMDEIGLMVTDIDENGFISFTNVGGVDQRILLAQEVTIHGKKDLIGIIATKPPHLQAKDEKKKAVKMEDMVIDAGLSKKDAEKVISIGNVITFQANSSYLLNDYICGKSMDNKVGIMVMLECLKELKNIDIGIDLYAVATAQEELGLRGATVSSYNINPDVGIAIDVSHGDTPDAPADKVFLTGKGPIITVGPNIHKNLAKDFIKVAKQYNIPFQKEVAAGQTGTDAWAIQITRSGIPTLLLSVPLRYMHTNVETVSLNDIVNAGRLLAFTISKFKNKLEGLLCY